MKKFLLPLLPILFLVSCTGWSRCYSFRFNNESQYDVHIIIDTNTQDGAISVGSLCYYCRHELWKFIDNDKPWYNIVRDSAYIYVVDASRIYLLSGQLAQDDQEKITPEMILGIITIHNQDLYEMYTVNFSSE